MVCLIKSDERKMKKYLSAIVGVLLTAGCSWLNPFSSETPQPTTFEPNQFMWQAAHDKLAFMPVAEEDKKAGVMTTAWQKSDNADNTEFKIEVKVLSTKLRADGLKVKSWSREKVRGQWVESKTSYEFNQRLENAILNKARVLYRQSLAIK